MRACIGLSVGSPSYVLDQSAVGHVILNTKGGHVKEIMMCNYLIENISGNYIQCDMAPVAVIIVLLHLLYKQDSFKKVESVNH